jgi:hypothetical protein
MCKVDIDDYNISLKQHSSEKLAESSLAEHRKKYWQVPVVFEEAELNVIHRKVWLQTLLDVSQVFHLKINYASRKVVL